MRLLSPSSTSSAPSSGYDSADDLPSQSLSFKVIVVGDPAVGKSCLLLQFTDQRFKNNHDLTIGAEYTARFVNVGDTTVQLKIWDTAGCEQFRSMTQNYYRGAVGAVLVYDVTRRETFEHLPQWLDELSRSCDENVKILLVGNKNDMDLSRQVRVSEGQNFAREHGILFLETSAKTARNVNRLFGDLTSQILKSSGFASSTDKGSNTSPVLLAKKQQKNTRANCC